MSKNKLLRTGRSSYHRQRGLSLVELMIAMVIGLLLIAATGNIYLAGRQAFQDQDESARMQETARFVLSALSRVISTAGRTEIGPTNVLWDFQKSQPGISPIAASNGASGAADTLTVRFVSASTDVDCVGGNVTGNAGGLLVAQTLSLNGTDLRCQRDAVAPMPLASNVEDFQIQFGLDTNATDGARNVDQYADPTAANAAQALAVRVCILVRTEDRVAPSAQSYTDCKGNAQNATDRRIRRTFTRVIGLKNWMT